MDGRAAWAQTLRQVSDGQLRALEKAARANLARGADSPEGFTHFYALVFKRELPRHALDEWVRPLYRARSAGKGLVVEAFRGSSKTTTLTVAFTAYRIGREPHRSNLIIQASDEQAADSAAQVADLIARNPGWRIVFPQVRPDRAAGWGANGYEVKRTDMDYAEWRALCGREKGKDPTLVGLGYQSRAVVGKHPSGLLVVDDIHNESNTRSRRELKRVVDILQGSILPTVTPDTWQVFVGTPWTANDALAYLKSTGRFLAARTPILQDTGKRAEEEPDAAAEEADRGLGGLDAEGTGVKPAWPERFPAIEIEKQRQLAGEKEFARMFLLDLQAAEGMHLKNEWLHPYPHEKIQPSWPVMMGVDYASTAEQLGGGRRDYFAVAIGRALPGGGGVVLVDGFRGRVSQGEAEQQLKALAALYPTTQVIGVEAVGKGEEFYHLLLRGSRLPVIPMQPGGRSKGQRFERGMAPLFQFGRAWVADVEMPFLRAFRDEWLRWPNGDYDDTLDAVYWMLFAARHHMAGSGRAGKKQANPFAGLGRG